MTADLDALIHRVITAADGEEVNFVFVVREALTDTATLGHRAGYADCLRDQHQAQWLAGHREKQAATEAAGSGEAHD